MPQVAKRRMGGEGRMTDWQANYLSLVAELREQADWWQARAKECTRPGESAMLDGCSRKIRMIVDDFRDEQGNRRPTGPRATPASLENPRDT
jgi:hypothetical protein